MTTNFKSPLRYPGGKVSLTGVITRIIKDQRLEGGHLFEPYAGSAAISIALIGSGVCSSASISERDPLLYSFWKCVFTNPSKLLHLINNTAISLSTWHSLRPLLNLDEPDESQIDMLAFSALFFNRTNFSGVLHSGPIGGQSQDSNYDIDCRFNRDELTERIELLTTLRDKVDVQFADALDVIKAESNNDRVLFYVDPPYFLQGKKLYRYNYRLKGHIALADSLRKANFPWLLSYDNHDVIENLYEDFHNVYQEFRYSSRLPKKESELLITNLPLQHLGAGKLKLVAAL
ncbi:DNA adenine methylase [Nitrosospira sp. Nsp1]|uniref:DNA adenine methylase n=1 Tax=Nitrosospira sp. Nsp1 TaxID=136547 RepID=UPI00088F6260|nr:DNA adenine methylase [Nitrosospira sp. Nsp1]SCX37306.1 DNA adenine methylase [Nitrosospira sp. Nsp1]